MSSWFYNPFFSFSIDIPVSLFKNIMHIIHVQGKKFTLYSTRFVHSYIYPLKEIMTIHLCQFTQSLLVMENTIHNWNHLHCLKFDKKINSKIYLLLYFEKYLLHPFPGIPSITKGKILFFKGKILPYGNLWLGMWLIRNYELPNCITPLGRQLDLNPRGRCSPVPKYLSCTLYLLLSITGMT